MHRFLESVFSFIRLLRHGPMLVATASNYVRFFDVACTMQTSSRSTPTRSHGSTNNALSVSNHHGERTSHDGVTCGLRVACISCSSKTEAKTRKFSYSPTEVQYNDDDAGFRLRKLEVDDDDNAVAK
ncbi:hypothetical protein VNO80_07033 [Phaseolus coccineus]|uniref:Uncharacterized protein n=1 Tax=Phaseolus coccineus TaxID=3886 RepID=A0AAN9NMV1_PHACN